MKKSKILNHILKLSDNDFQILSDNLKVQNISLNKDVNFAIPKKEKTFSLQLNKVVQKLYTVKCIKENLNIGLFEAKNMIDILPCIIYSGTNLEFIKNFQNQLKLTDAETRII